jgi:hypothetical protein
MTAPTIERTQADLPEPLPSVFAVRAEVEPFADVRHFDEEIDAAIQSAAATGSFEALRGALRTWLGIALMAKHADTHARLPFEQRGVNRDRMVAQWLAEHAAASAR